MATLLKTHFKLAKTAILAIVINMLVDIIDDLDTESYVLTEDGQEYVPLSYKHAKKAGCGDGYE